jgi:hypothetical protein
MSPILSIVSIVIIHKVKLSKLIVRIVIMSYFCGKPKNTQWGVFSPQLYGKAHSFAQEQVDIININILYKDSCVK